MIKVRQKLKLENFKFWSGGADRASLLTDEELSDFESHLEELYPDGIEDTTLNDLFWFDFEWVCEQLGLNADEVLDREIYRNRRN